VFASLLGLSSLPPVPLVPKRTRNTYDSRSGARTAQRSYTPVVALLAKLLRVAPSTVQGWFSKKDVVEIAEPKIHMSVIDRMKNGAFAYAPIGVPARYAVVDMEGRILPGGENTLEPPGEAEARAAAQERVWNLVPAPGLLPHLFASFNLALFRLRTIRRATEFESPLPLVSKLVRFAGELLPGFAQAWIDAFAARPQRFVVALGVVVGLMLLGVYLGARVSDAMRDIWKIVKSRWRSRRRRPSCHFRRRISCSACEPRMPTGASSGSRSGRRCRSSRRS